MCKERQRLGTAWREGHRQTCMGKRFIGVQGNTATKRYTHTAMIRVVDGPVTPKVTNFGLDPASSSNMAVEMAVVPKAETVLVSTGNVVNWNRLKKKVIQSATEEVSDCAFGEVVNHMATT